MVKTVQHDGNNICHYNIVRINGMQDDTALSDVTEYTGECYAPDGNEDVDFGAQLRSMIDYQVSNIKTMQYRNSQTMNLTQSTFAFNSYLYVNDGGSDARFWSVLYDTRGLTAEEAGARNRNYTPGQAYRANLFPDQKITDGQYLSIMYRWPSNQHETDTYTLGNTYCYDVRSVPSDPGYSVVENRIIDSSLTGQSFRYSGACDWQDWTDGAGNIRWAQFWIEDEKGDKTYITPKLYPNWCDPDGTMYLYYVNSLGGIDFVRSTYASVTEMNTSRDMYETNNSIDDRFKFGEETYHQTRWNSYTFNTEIVSEDNSFNMADVVNTRWAWLYIPGDTVPWRSVKVTDTTAKVKQARNEGNKLYNYTFQLEDSIKAKIV
jgi:hypothetical protein